ncbi:MAG: pyruvate ferredoxin oxidoreductase [Acidobacteriota bacterium]
MKKVIMGNHAVSFGAMLSKAEVIAAYPITPQTQIVEELSEMCADGRLNAKFIKVESEHSAMACCIGASAVGARAFTATSSQGLALMHELLHYAAGARLPIVMANINRAMAPAWNIWSDQTDSLSQRDTGWLQFYCESNQEVLDTVIQAFKISEKLLLPSMVILDAFFLSHTYEPVDIPDQAIVDAFLPPWKAEYTLDINNPRAFGALAKPDSYMEMRFDMHRAMEIGKSLAREIDEEFGNVFGRRWGIIEPYRLDQAEIVLVSSGTMASTTRVVVDSLREKGENVGMLKIKMFRPFPAEDVAELLRGRIKVAVMDRNFSFGGGGIWAQEIKSVIYNVEASIRPVVFGYITGLGGRDVKPDVMEEIYFRTKGSDFPESDSIWIGVQL